MTPTETLALQAINQITDLDGLPAVGAFSFQWQQSALGGGGVFTNIAGATNDSFTPTQDQVNRQLRVVVSYTDLQGHPESRHLGGDDRDRRLHRRRCSGADPQRQCRAGHDLRRRRRGHASTAMPRTTSSTAARATTRSTAAPATTPCSAAAGADALNGGADADTMTGGADGDTANGAAGDDRFIATIGDGNDSYIGAAGIDTYDLSGNGGGCDGHHHVRDKRGDRHRHARPRSRTSSAARATTASPSTAALNLIDGQDGNDTLNAGAGNDTVLGGLGDDTISGGAGADVLNGNDGDDTFNYTIGDGADTIDGGAGTNDRVNILGGPGAAAQTLAVVLAGTAITAFAGSTVTGIESFTARSAGRRRYA